MNLQGVDWAVIAGFFIVAALGWRSGVIATVASFAGFLSGAIAGAWLVAQWLSDSQWPSLLKGTATIAGMLLVGSLGRAIFGAGGRALRGLLAVAPLRLLDRSLGLAVSGAAFLLSTWLVLSVAADFPSDEISDPVRHSRSFPLLDALLAGPGGALLADAQALIDTWNLPKLPFNPAPLPPLQDPGDVKLPNAVVATATASVVRVTANSDRCSERAVGSGVVSGPAQVITNAHVVTGSDTVEVQIQNGRTRRAIVVFVDFGRDLAILRVPGLSAPVPKWVVHGARGEAAAIAGHPHGGRLKIRGARIRGDASLPRQTGGGRREVVVFSGLVERGNSGGPLLDFQGRVVGLVFASSSLDDHTGFALAPSEVTPAIWSSRNATTPVATGACPKGVS